ncbi:hypothetical protein SAMN05660330_01709 [Desulforhopalus singaporensis]|uniref:Uncharacterized protein n=1 Tax=Desulforhopalus singaporensis TaxID=91360 RepID=A0A1H0PLH3_9BACT|nr:hypothetical protein SAMN05660330_01709 [Desulforhopalus singaporensis]
MLIQECKSPVVLFGAWKKADLLSLCHKRGGKHLVNIMVKLKAVKVIFNGESKKIQAIQINGWLFMLNTLQLT